MFDKDSFLNYKEDLFLLAFIQKESPLYKEDLLEMKNAWLIAITLLIIPGLFSAQEVTEQPSSDQPSLELKNIYVNKSENQMEIQLELDSPVSYESFTLIFPNRLIIDLFQVTNFSCDPDIDVNDIGVVKIRTRKNQPEVTRVVFDLDENIPSYSIEEKEGGIFIYFALEIPEIDEAVEEEVVQPEVVIEEPKEEVKEDVEVPQVVPPKIAPTRAEEPEKKDLLQRKRRKTLMIDLGGGIYFAQDPDFREVYGNTATSTGGGITFLLPLSEKEDVGIALDFRYIFSTGRTTYTDEEVKLALTPLSLNVYYQRLVGRVTPFAGLGADYFNYKETYPDTFPVSDTSGTLMGYNLVLGMHVKIIQSLSLKALFKLHIAKKTENDIETNLSGNEYGLKLAYSFNL